MNSVLALGVATHRVPLLSWCSTGMIPLSLIGTVTRSRRLLWARRHPKHDAIMSGTTQRYDDILRVDGIGQAQPTA